MAKWRRVDWRGWVVLAWVIYWGICYGNMAVRARGQRVLFWFTRNEARASDAQQARHLIQHDRGSALSAIEPGDRDRDRPSQVSRSQARQ